MLVLDFITCSLGANIGIVDLDTKAEASKTQIATTVKRRLRIIIAVAFVSLVLFLLVLDKSILSRVLVYRRCGYEMGDILAYHHRVATGCFT
jgi:hypothetical protein